MDWEARERSCHISGSVAAPGITCSTVSRRRHVFAVQGPHLACSVTEACRVCGRRLHVARRFALCTSGSLFLLTHAVPYRCVFLRNIIRVCGMNTVMRHTQDFKPAEQRSAQELIKAAADALADAPTPATATASASSASTVS